MEEHSLDSGRMSEEQRSTDPDVVRHALAEIAAGIERGEIGLAAEQSTEAAS